MRNRSILRTRKLHEPISPYGSGTYNSLITVVQAVPIAVFVWVMVDKSEDGQSLFRKIASSVSVLDFPNIPYSPIVKMVISFLGIITIWHSYITNDQFHAYRQKYLDTAIPFTFGVLESCAILTIPSESTSWFAFWLLAIMALGILAIWNMKHQMLDTRALGLFKDHFDEDADQIFRAVIEYCEKTIEILRQSFVIMFGAFLTSTPLGVAAQIQKNRIDLVLVTLAYLISIVRLKQYDLDFYLGQIERRVRGWSKREVETLEIDGRNIEIISKEFLPSVIEKKDEEAILFFPGWSAGSARTLDRFVWRLAEDGKVISLSIQTRSASTDHDSLLRESKAIRLHLLKKRYKFITVVAQSEGCIKAVSIIDLFQRNNPDVLIRGLILLAPVGVYHQNKYGLIARFLKDLMIETPISIALALLKEPAMFLRSLQAGSDVICNIVRDMRLVGLRYPKKFYSQIVTLAKANTSYMTVRCPIVLITGFQDPVASADAILDGKKNTKLFSLRQKNLKESFFPNAAQIRMLIPRKFGHHGLLHFRADQISRVALYMIDRFWRSQKSGDRFDAHSAASTPGSR